MRTTLSSLVVTVLFAASAAQAQAGARLLALDVMPRGDVSADEADAVQGLITDAMRGRENLLVATSRDVRQRAPLQADRAATCESELCLHELADALDADFVLFTHVEPSEEGRVVRLGLFEEKSGAILMREEVSGADVSTLAPFLTAAVDRLLDPVLAEAKPSFFETPLFLAGAGVSAVGLLVAAGAGGYALELELGLAEPDRDRDVKQRAITQGPVVLAAAGAGAAIAAIGAGLLFTAVFVE